MDEQRAEPADKSYSSDVPDNHQPLSVIKADVNLSRLPFFALVHANLEHFKIELTIVETRGDEQLELGWKVTANSEYGYPGLFAKKVHRAIEYLLIRNGFPVPEYLEFSLYEIIKLLGLEPSGKTRAQIKQAILSITSTLIESKGTFCYLDNGEKRWVEDYFHLYERVIFAGRRLPDGTIADKNRIYFNQWYLRSLNSLYIKPLDFNYWNSLKKDIAGRLYEYLSLMAFARKCKPFRIEYYRLCEFLPITPQKYFSKAKQILSRAHQELIKTEFLKKVAWRKSKVDEKKWIITYYFGLRAKSELQRGFNDDTYRPVILAVETADIEEIEEVIESEEKETQAVKPKRKQAKEEKELSKIAQALCERGITKAFAIDFAENFSQEYLAEKIALHDYQKEIGELTTNAAGWLREAIVRDYKPSEEQLKKQTRMLEKQVQQEEQRTLEEKAREIQEQRLLEALKAFPEEKQWVRERVVEHVKVREMTIKAFGGEQFTEEEIEEMYLRYKAQVPKTDEEKRAWLISNKKECALSTIVEELRKKQQSRKEEPKEEPAKGQPPFNSIGEVLGEVARQMAEFEAEQKKSENEN